jgi:hypothetical protein
VGQTAADKNAARRAANKKIIQEAKSVPCVDCGGSFPWYCMDFDHRPGEVKSFGVSGLYWKSSGAVRAEIAKCDIVCANCHRIRTHERGYAS